MDARYLLVRGVPGHLVPHPYANARRYLGKSPANIASWAEGPVRDGKPQWPASRPEDEVIAEDGEGFLRKMICKGGLVLVRECKAASLDEAREKLAAMAPQEN